MSTAPLQPPPSGQIVEIYDWILAATTSVADGICPSCRKQSIQFERSQFCPFTCRWCGFDLANNPPARELADRVRQALPLAKEISQPQVMAFWTLSRLDRLRKALWGRYLDLLDERVGIQPGPLTLAVTEAERSVITRAVVEEVCGEHLYQRVREASMRTVRVLNVRRTGPS